jgi:putative membrane protein
MGMGILVSWGVVTLALWAASEMLDGMKIEGGFFGHLITAGVFGLLNVLVGWLLFLVLGFVSFGLGFVFAFVTRVIVTAILLKVTDALSSKLTVRSFGTALVAALIMSVVTGVTEWVLRVAGVA